MHDLANGMLVFARASALLAFLPVFSAQNFPVQLRVALGALTAFLIAPLLSAVDPSQLSLWSFIRLVLMELFIGWLFAFVSRMVFFAIDFAGSLIATEMGLNMSADFNPFNQSRAEAPGLILYYLAIVLFFSLDLHHWLFLAFERTYALLPIGGFQLRENLLLEIINRTSLVFLVSVQMAAPLIAITFLINLIFSILGRAVPQMNVFAESFGFRTLSGLLVFGLTLNLMAQHIVNYLRQIPEDVVRVAKLLSLQS